MSNIVNFANKDWILVPERNDLKEVEEHIKSNYHILEVLYEDLIIKDTFQNKLETILQINDLIYYKFNWNSKKIEKLE